MGGHFRCVDLFAGRLCVGISMRVHFCNVINFDVINLIELNFHRVCVVLAESLQKWRALHRQLQGPVLLQVNQFDSISFNSFNSSFAFTGAILVLSLKSTIERR